MSLYNMAIIENNNIKITSKIMKRELLKYFRFERGMVTGTEVNSADVLSISDDLSRSYEIEIKTSLNDLKRDFTKKAIKHAYIENSNNKLNPNFFYFCIPEDVLEKAQEIIEINNDRYGIICMQKYGNLQFIKKPRRLNKADNTELYKLLVKRISSELVNMYMKYELNE